MALLGFFSRPLVSVKISLNASFFISFAQGSLVPEEATTSCVDISGDADYRRHASRMAVLPFSGKRPLLHPHHLCFVLQGVKLLHKRQKAPWPTCGRGQYPVLSRKGIVIYHGYVDGLIFTLLVKSSIQFEQDTMSFPS